MDPQTLFINTRTGAVARGNQSHQAPVLSAILGTELVLAVAFVTDDVVVALGAVTSSKLVVKAVGDQEGPALLLDNVWSAAGSGVSTRYTFRTLADSVGLRAAIQGKETLMLKGQVELQLSDEDTPRRCVPFELMIINSYVQTDEGAPDVDPDTFDWLNASLVVGPTLKKTVGGSTITLAANVALTRVSSDMGISSGFPTDLFTWALVANAVYELELTLLMSGESGTDISATLTPPAAADAFGRWSHYIRGVPSGTQTGADEGGLIFTDDNGDGLDVMYQTQQRAMIVTGGTAGNLMLTAAASAGNGWLRANSWATLTRLA